MQGLTIVSADDEEVVVINVMGDIEPEYFGDVMVALNVDDAPDVQIASVGQ
jgi:dUTPase